MKGLGQDAYDSALADARALRTELESGAKQHRAVNETLMKRMHTLYARQQRKNPTVQAVEEFKQAQIQVSATSQSRLLEHRTCKAAAACVYLQIESLEHASMLKCCLQVETAEVQLDVIEEGIDELTSLEKFIQGTHPPGESASVLAVCLRPQLPCHALENCSDHAGRHHHVYYSILEMPGKIGKGCRQWCL